MWADPLRHALGGARQVKQGARSVMRREEGHGGEDSYMTVYQRGCFAMGVADGVYMWRTQVRRGWYRTAHTPGRGGAVASWGRTNRDVGVDGRIWRVAAGLSLDVDGNARCR